MLLKYRQLNFSNIQECGMEGQWCWDTEDIPECERHIKMMAREVKIRRKENENKFKHQTPLIPTLSLYRQAPSTTNTRFSLYCQALCAWHVLMHVFLSHLWGRYYYYPLLWIKKLRHEEVK